MIHSFLGYVSYEMDNYLLIGMKFCRHRQHSQTTASYLVSPTNACVSSIGRDFRPLVRWRWKMAALPLPVALLVDLICGSRKWGHPRWRPEAEGPPFFTSTSLGVETPAPGPGWHHFRRRHLGSKMVAPRMTSGGRRDACSKKPPSCRSLLRFKKASDR